MRIHQAEGRNKNGPTTAEDKDVQKTIEYMLDAGVWFFRKARKCARPPAERPMTNMARA